MGFAEFREPRRERFDRRLVRHADGEVVESGGGCRAVRVQSQAQIRAAVGMRHGDAHQRAAFDELQLDPVAEPAGVPVAGPGQVADRQLEVVDPGEGWSRWCVNHFGLRCSTSACLQL
jgi:hypothetical protein